YTYGVVCHCMFFFFQAEDGIRGFHVTGVQTCALPICGISTAEVKKVTSALKYIAAIRRHGHLDADIFAVGKELFKTSDAPELDPKTYGLTDEDLKGIPAELVWEGNNPNVETAYDVVQWLREKYTGKISFEFDHIQNEEERNWLIERIESGSFEIKLSDLEKKK